MRFLSHAETIRLFQRACIRAGIKLEYSQGFNPHPKLYLPLPRTVGIESDDELLCLRLESLNFTLEKESFQKRFTEQLPEGIDVFSVEISETAGVCRPVLARYILSLKISKFDSDKDVLKDRIKFLLDSQSFNIKRTSEKKRAVRNIDARPYLKSIELRDRDIIVECKISLTGALRVDEILTLLGINIQDLALPVRRTGIQWQCN